MPLHQNQIELLLEPVSSMTISANSCWPWTQLILKQRTDSKHKTNAGDEKNVQNNEFLNRIVGKSNKCFRLDHGSWSNGPSVATFYYRVISGCVSGSVCMAFTVNSLGLPMFTGPIVASWWRYHWYHDFARSWLRKKSKKFDIKTKSGVAAWFINRIKPSTVSST